jgi:hypothetical protein
VTGDACGRSGCTSGRGRNKACSRDPKLCARCCKQAELETSRGGALASVCTVVSHRADGKAGRRQATAQHFAAIDVPTGPAVSDSQPSPSPSNTLPAAPPGHYWGSQRARGNRRDLAMPLAPDWGMARAGALEGRSADLTRRDLMRQLNEEKSKEIKIIVWFAVCRLHISYVVTISRTSSGRHRTRSVRAFQAHGSDLAAFPPVRCPSACRAPRAHCYVRAALV